MTTSLDFLSFSSVCCAMITIGDLFSLRQSRDLQGGAEEKVLPIKGFGLECM